MRDHVYNRAPATLDPWNPGPPQISELVVNKSGSCCVFVCLNKKCNHLLKASELALSPQSPIRQRCYIYTHVI